MREQPGWAKWLVVAAASAFFGVTTTAHAENAAANALFQEGKRLFDAGTYPQACPKFAAANKLETSARTSLYLGDCYEKTQKLASSMAAFKLAEKLSLDANDEKRASIAKLRQSALDPQVSRVTFKAGARPEGLTVRLDSLPLPPGSWDTPVPIDAGNHRFEASAPGYSAWSRDIVVTNGGKQYSVDLMLQKTAGPAPVPGPTPLPGPVVPKPLPKEEGVNGLLIAGIAVTGLGVAGVVVGSIFGSKAFADKDEALAAGDNGNPPCVDFQDDLPVECTQAGLDLLESADDAATVSTITFIAGGVALAGGITMVILSLGGDNSSTGKTPSFQLAATPTTGGAFLSLSGEF